MTPTIRTRGTGRAIATRPARSAARALADWLRGDPTASGDSDALIIGDLNAYRREDPLRVLAGQGFVDLLADGRSKDRDGFVSYTFAFRGALGALDHALASPSLASQVVRAAVWPVNASAAPLLDYNLDNDRDPSLVRRSLTRSCIRS